jgi:hypothetical protein
VLSARRELVHDRAFNVGRDDENFQVRQLAEIVRQAVPGSRVTFADGAGPDKRSYSVAFDRIRETLPSWRPQWTVQAGVLELMWAYRRAGLSHDDFASSKFKRVLRIRELQRAGLIDLDLNWVPEAAHTSAAALVAQEVA